MQTTKLLSKVIDFVNVRYNVVFPYTKDDKTNIIPYFFVHFSTHFLDIVKFIFLERYLFSKSCFVQ